MANSNTQQNRKKEKMVLFKSKNEAVLAVIVLLLFVGTLIYNVVAYVQEQNPPTQVASEVVPSNDPNLDPVARDLAAEKAAASGQAMQENPAGATQSVADPNVEASQTPQPEEPTSASTSATPTSSDGGFPVLPVLLGILLLIGGFGAMKYFSKNSDTSNSPAYQGGANSSGNGKFVFAKTQKEKNLLIIVFVLFVVVSVYNLTVFFSKPSETLSADMPQTQEEYFARKQQAGLESLNENTAAQPAPADPSGISADANDIYSKTLELQGQNSSASPDLNMQNAAGADSGSEIEIVSRNSASSIARRNLNSKRIMISVSESGRSNPFLPAAENVPPSSLPKFSVLPPPEQVSEGSDADNVMGTTISGILYDKYSPSAIITIGGNDYLVKKGDLINRYRVLSITKEEVVVQLGKNIYKAGVGQLLVKSSINFNTISNLDRKFAGNEVPVNVRKKR